MLWFAVSVLVALGVIGGIYWRWKRQVEAEIAEGAGIEWAHFQQHEPEFLGDMTEEKFRAVYARVNMPRFPGYALAAFSTFLLSLPVTFTLLAVLLWAAQAFGVSPEPVEVADRLLLRDDGQMIFFRDTPPEAALYYLRDLAGFYYFFGVMAVWLIIVAFFTRRFHARRPGYLRDEIIRAREE